MIKNEGSHLGLVMYVYRINTDAFPIPAHLYMRIVECQNILAHPRSLDHFIGNELLAWAKL